MKRHSTKENIISALLGLAIAIPIVTLAIEDKKIDALPIVEEEVVQVDSREKPPIVERVEFNATSEELVEEELIYLGEFKITAYCSCKKCCGKWAESRPVDEDGEEIVIGASGKRLVGNYSIAVDPKVIPYGTTVYIGDNEYIAHDCGGAIKENRIDLYMNSHQDAREWGVQYHDVYIVSNS